MSERVEGDFRAQVTHRWWVVLVVVVAAFVPLLLWWQPVAELARPGWQATTWHLVDVADTRLVVAVHDEVCGDEESGPTRVRVSEGEDRVIIAAERQVPGWLPSLLPGACAPRTAVVEVEVDLAAPLGVRALYGCRPASSAAAAEQGADVDDCRGLTEPPATSSG